MTTEAHFRPDLLKQAETILARLSLTTEVKASRDIMVIDNLLRNKAQSMFDFDTVNKRLREEYPAIEELENLSRNNPPASEEHIKDSILFSDKFGIYATILVRNHVIREVKEVIQEYIVG